MRGCLVAALPCIAGALLAPTPRVTTTLRQSQATPERFERADDAQRLAKRIETVLARRTSRLIVVLERLVDGHNYSAIFRTCEALGVQHVWVVAPPPGAARFESRSSLRRKAKAERARQYAANDENRRPDDQPVRAGSRKDRRRRKAADAFRSMEVQLIGDTPCRSSRQPLRPLEITDWLRNDAKQRGGRRAPRWVVIDDRHLLEEVGGDELEGRFVQVDPTVGLDAATVDRAVGILQVAEAPADSRRQPRSWWRRCRHGLSWLVVCGAHQQGDAAPR